MKKFLTFLLLLATAVCAEESTLVTRVAFADLQASDRQFLSRIESAARNRVAEPTVIFGQSSSSALNRPAPRKAVARTERAGEETSGSTKGTSRYVPSSEWRSDPSEGGAFIRVSSEPRVTLSVTPWWITRATTIRTTFRIRSAAASGGE